MRLPTSRALRARAVATVEDRDGAPRLKRAREGRSEPVSFRSREAGCAAVFSADSVDCTQSLAVFEISNVSAPSSPIRSTT